MARVKDIGIDEVPEDARQVYQQFADEYGPLTETWKFYKHWTLQVQRKKRTIARHNHVRVSGNRAFQDPVVRLVFDNA